MKKRRLLTTYAICAAVYLATASCYAEDQYDYNDTDIGFVQSDGRSGTEEWDTDTTITRTSRSNTTMQYTSAETSALNKKSNLRNKMKDLINEIKNDPDSGYGEDFFTNDGNRIMDLAVKTYDPRDMVDEFNAAMDYIDAVETAKAEGNGWVDRNTKASERIIPWNIGEYNTLSFLEKCAVLISLNLTSGKPIGNEAHYRFSGFTLDNQKPVQIHFDDSYEQHNQHFLDYTIPGGTNVRSDLYVGFPQLRDTSEYSKRFTGWLKWADDNGFPKDTSGHIADTSNIEWSAVVVDEMYIGYLTEYQIEDVKKDVIKSYNFTSNQRRWKITLNGQEIPTPIITDNELHELNLTEIYEQYGPGTYHIVPEQLATVTRATYVEYDICEYLFDVRTGTILWFNEQKVSALNGRGVYVGETTSATPEWIATGDEFTRTINRVGEVQHEGGTQREE